MVVTTMMIRAIAPSDRDWVSSMLIENWGALNVVSRGRRHWPLELSGLMAERDGAACGAVHYVMEGQSCELVSLVASPRGAGAGTRLLEALIDHLRSTDCQRLWLVTTNDNTDALRFYQKRGFTLAALHLRAVDKARELKPEIPLVGEANIPVRDELELERWLAHPQKHAEE
jgi:N-acetylglutamate synthase-like GNAT family acetyltransferase